MYSSTYSCHFLLPPLFLEWFGGYVVVRVTSLIWLINSTLTTITNPLFTLFDFVLIISIMKKKKSPVMKPSESLANKLDNVLSVFSNALSSLNMLASETQFAINQQEEKIKEARLEVEAMTSTLNQINGVKDNITKLLEPAT